MLGYLSLDIICSSKLTVSLELRSRKTRFSEQIMSKDKYRSIFSRQMEATIYLCAEFSSHLGIHTAENEIYLLFKSFYSTRPRKDNN